LESGGNLIIPHINKGKFVYKEGTENKQSERVLTKNYKCASIENVKRSPSSQQRQTFAPYIPEDNSLSNLSTLRGFCGSHLRVRVLQNFS
jgi:hypothetical protein